MLVASLRGDRVEASRDLERSQEFICPGCGTPVLLKKGRVKISHFAHLISVGCEYAVGETIGHMFAKKLFCDAARLRGLRAELEFVIDDQRADVAIWSPDNDFIVIELQHSNLPVDDMKARISGYRRKRVAQVWIPFILPRYFEQDAECRLIERYSIRPFERYLSKIYQENFWFYSESHHSMFLGKLTPKWLAKDSAEFGNEYYEGYDYVSRRWRKLSLVNAVAIKDVFYSLTPNRFLGVELSA